MRQQPFGLYYHIPFCSALCHYCDFNKTARWDGAVVKQYFSVLKTQTEAWFEAFPLTQWPLSSVFFGGGTPGLFAREYEDLFALWSSRGIKEITLEANPNDLTHEHLAVWKSLGVTRLSVGVQSFSPAGLSFLTRDHKPEDVISGVQRAQGYIEHINLDLIYGWQGQTLKDWTYDLAQAVALKTQHLSLYNLTYAAHTPIGRAQQRGRIHEQEDSLLEAYYLEACAVLGEHGFAHDEISNWAKKGYSCRHNHLYWQDGFYLAVGTSACGYVPDGSLQGLRYRYQPGLNGFLKARKEDVEEFLSGQARAPRSLLQVDERKDGDWLIEYVACGLRCAEGLDIERIKKKGGVGFKPTETLLEAKASGLVDWSDKKITLRREEWFREGFWGVEVLKALA